ncbi:hypothetical protein ACSS31_27425 (plasmid) [Priestia megaterium]
MNFIQWILQHADQIVDQINVKDAFMKAVKKNSESLINKQITGAFNAGEQLLKKNLNQPKSSLGAESAKTATATYFSNVIGVHENILTQEDIDGSEFKKDSQQFMLFDKASFDIYSDEDNQISIQRFGIVFKTKTNSVFIDVSGQLTDNKSKNSITYPFALKKDDIYRLNINQQIFENNNEFGFIFMENESLEVTLIIHASDGVKQLTLFPDK